MTEEKKKELNLELLKIYKLIVYTENIKDTIDDLSSQGFQGIFEHTYKSCKNFLNRLNSKKTSKRDILLEALFYDKKGSVQMNKYRDALDKAIDVILETNPEDYGKLEAIRTFNTSKDMVLMNTSELKTLITSAKLDTNTTENFLKKWQASKKIATKSTLSGG